MMLSENPSPLKETCLFRLSKDYKLQILLLLTEFFKFSRFLKDVRENVPAFFMEILICPRRLISMSGRGV
jgi:hypothetical protein